jgi:hypothetical protein
MMKSNMKLDRQSLLKNFCGFYIMLKDLYRLILQSSLKNRKFLIRLTNKYNKLPFNNLWKLKKLVIYVV